ncbi:MAG TPA: ABC transporter permease [Terracidiphilus sp.]|nr:ABC transporter permease [Terracidiphilus sp.]
MTRGSFAARALAQLRSWLRSVMHRGRLESEMEAELANHLDSLTADLVRAGQLPDEAARRARIELGSATVLKEEMRASLGLRWWDELHADLRYGARVLMKSPGVTAVAAISLALAIGANTTIFSLTKQLLYTRLDVPHAENLRLLAWTGTENHVAVHHVWGDWNPLPGGRAASTAFSYPVYRQLRAGGQVLDSLFAFKRMGMIATIGDDGQRVRTELVSGNYFDSLGLRPQMGRAIESSDDTTPGQGAVAVISDQFWDRAYGRSPAVLGTQVKLNDISFTVVGIAPSGFTGVKDALLSVDFFIPLAMQPLVLPRRGSPSLFTDSRTWWVNIMGCARPGISDSQAQAELNGELSAIVRATMRVKPGEDLPQLDLRDGSRGLFVQKNEYARPMTVLMILSGLVLLLGCANIANLMLARGAKRQREMSVRLALGAGRRRIVRQLLVESVLLASLGGACGLVTSYLGRNVLPRMIAATWEHTDFQINFDWKVFLFTVAITVFSGILFGLAPAFSASRAQLNHGLKESAQTATRRRKGAGGKALVGFQIALSTLLVIGAGLFLRTLTGLSAVDVGFRTDHLLLAEVDPPNGRYLAGKDVALHQRLERAFSIVPGVVSVTLAEDPYIADDRSANDFLPQGEVYDPGKSQEENYNIVGNQFFTTLAIPILEGRGFGSQDTSSSPKVAVINQSLARQRFPGQDPIGKHFVTDPHDSDGGGGALPKNSIEIVGLCGDTRYMNLRDEPPPQFFLPYIQQASVGGMVYEIRTLPKPESVLPALRQIVRQIDPDLALVNVRTQQQQIDSTLQNERIFVMLTSGFGLLALALAAVGIYGIMAYSVAQRINEMGIRLALGATPRQLLAMVLREASWLSIAGIGAGAGVCLLLAQLVKSMLYGIAPNDPLTFFGTAMLLIAIALVASWIPACRAASVQPIDALRHE